MKQQKLYILALFALIGFFVVFSVFLVQSSKAEEKEFKAKPPLEVSIQNGTVLSPKSSPPSYKNSEVTRKIRVIVTGYSSTPGQTDSTPFITASGEKVKKGTAANNLLSFGTKIRMPEIFEDQVFEVADRMHSDKSYYQVDIWFPTKKQAEEFGTKRTTMEILSD